MRICAVRGRNLASLAGDFEVRFDAPPLSDAGLFAITGPTGAGKSTLLDAMCLALFDDTPRLQGKSAHAVGLADEDEKLRLGTNDVRAVLRKGTGEGFAEVEFVGGDGRRYRARWSVARARKRPDGRLQQQTLSLVDVASEAEIGSGKLTETKALVVEKLGLTFHQFRHSVLLAQGEFAALLRAPATERAELLEQMTGTEIYARISRATFERAKREAEMLVALDEKQGATPPLDAPAREALEARRGAAASAVVASKERLDALRRELHAHATMAALEAALHDAEAQLAEAQARDDEAETARLELGELERLAPLRSLAQRADAARVAAIRAADALAGASATVASLEADVARASSVYEEAVAGQSSAAAAEAARAPELDEARRLDRELAAARSKLADDAQRAARADEEHRRELERAREASAKAASAQTELVELERTTAALSWAQRAAAAWEPTRALLGAATRALAAARADGDATLAPVESTPAAALARAREDLEAAAAAARAARDAHEAARRDVTALDGLDLVAELRARTAREDSVRALADLGRRARERAAALDAASSRASEMAAELTDVDRALEAALAERGALARERDERERAFEAQTAMATFASQRHVLRDGEPCPLCGADEHPFAKHAPVIDGLVERAREERNRARAALDAHDRAAAERDAARATLRQGLAQAVAERDGSTEALAALEVQWCTELARAELSCAYSPASTEAHAVIARWLAAIDDERRAAEERERAARGKRTEEIALRGAYEAAARRETACARAVEAERAIDELASAFDDEQRTRAAVVTDARRFAGDLEAAVTALRAFGGKAVALESAIRALETERGSCDTRADLLGKTLDEARRAAAASRAAVVALERERRKVLAGRSVEEVESEIARERDAREGATRGAVRALEDEKARLAVAESERARLEGVAESLRAQAERDSAELAASLEALGVDASRIEHASRIDDAHVAAERARLDGLRSEARLARAKRDDAAARREAHRTTLIEVRDATLVEAALAEEDRVHDATVGDERACREALLADDARRVEASAWLEERRSIAAQVDTWQALNGLIGSANGTKLRDFAQGLTFRALIEAANRHLAELARRYHLEPVPGRNLDLQVVDHDLGDDVRAVTSLSGGETFLVSLALALGLSSLDGGSARIESLFIDEGFGTLDERTLAIALDVLDALQATGRSVGIITHVSGIEGRLAARVRVESLRGGASRVRVEG